MIQGSFENFWNSMIENKSAGRDEHFFNGQNQFNIRKRWEIVQRGFWRVFTEFFSFFGSKFVNL